MSSDNVIKLNVGGVQMITYKDTLKDVPMLLNRFNSELSFPKLKESFFLDRDPGCFAAMLKFLRGYKLTREELQQASMEFHFWSGNAITDVPSEGERININDKEIEIIPDVLKLLPGLCDKIRNTIQRRDGLPCIKDAAHIVDALQDLRNAVVESEPMHPINWHRLNQAYGLEERVPLKQILSKKINQYEFRYTAKFTPDGNGNYTMSIGKYITMVSGEVAYGIHWKIGPFINLERIETSCVSSNDTIPPSKMPFTEGIKWNLKKVL
jgi:hypothetical protein